jgi:hypothetical protein
MKVSAILGCLLIWTSDVKADTTLLRELTVESPQERRWNTGAAGPGLGRRVDFFACSPG